ncbi:MAG: NADH-quinone oxidoreductase subunit L [Gammaproteobacteria bacterium]|nr:NADH-quinone oxidoreductase subunit L [Gammaproteobacteria bacterium]
MEQLCLLIVLAPLAASLVAGLAGRRIGRAGSHWVTIVGVGIAFALSAVVFKQVVIDAAGNLNTTVFTWLAVGGLRFEIGFLIDPLSATMMLVVTFVSWMVHIYTIGYMHDDPGYQRFFSYISLFTFSMLMLVMANNFLQLFFGWEAVGLVSYLLIGFWFKRPTAIYANLKAFLVNRVGDFGFLLGIAGVLFWLGTVDYATAFARAPHVQGTTVELFAGSPWSVMTLTCILLFVGAMGKSAQVPLHVWLPDSMEGPTPISALIHAATMVTAGIFMVARMSPLFELSETALSVVMVIGALTAFFMGLVGIVQNDIKRVVAYSTLSQLGYMTVALGASAYAAGIFHLVTHAFFKALLFLGAGSVIIAMHHEQDLRRMGGLRRYMPITYITMLVGSLALIGAPGFAGFFSKDAIIEAVHHADLPGAGLAYTLVLAGVFVTAFYSFRMFFLTFHTDERFRKAHAAGDHGHHGHEPQESPWVVTIPLIALAVPSVLAGYFIDPAVMGDMFDGVIYVAPGHDAIAHLKEGYHGVWSFMVHGFRGPAVYLALAGVAAAWFVYVRRPGLAAAAAARFHGLYRLLINKYYADDFNEAVFAAGGRRIGKWLWEIGDVTLIDGLAVNGSARVIGWFAGVARQMQTGYLYHYAFMMIVGLLGLMGYLYFTYGIIH